MPSTSRTPLTLSHSFRALLYRINAKYLGIPWGPRVGMSLRSEYFFFLPSFVFTHGISRVLTQGYRFYSFFLLLLHYSCFNYWRGLAPCCLGLVFCLSVPVCSQLTLGRDALGIDEIEPHSLRPVCNVTAVSSRGCYGLFVVKVSPSLLPLQQVISDPCPVCLAAELPLQRR